MAGVRTTSVFSDLMCDTKKQWTAAVERMADETYPGWRELFLQTNRRLPPQMRKELEPTSAWHAQRTSFVEGLLNWLGASISSTVIAEVSAKLDAVLDFAVFV